MNTYSRYFYNYNQNKYKYNGIMSMCLEQCLQNNILTSYFFTGVPESMSPIITYIGNASNSILKYPGNFTVSVCLTSNKFYNKETLPFNL